MPSFESREQPKVGFDYVAAAELARQKIEFESKSEKELGEDEYKKMKSHLKKAIKEYGNLDPNEQEKTPAARKIFELEVERQRLLQAQKNGEAPEILNPRQIKYDPESRMFVFEAKGGYTVKRTAGDLMSDIHWGIYYDVKALEKITELAEFVKIYKAKIFDAHLDEIEDEQILIERIEIDKIPASTPGKGIGMAYLEAYKSLKKRKAKRLNGETDTELPSGFAFERMIKCLVTKIAYDLGVKYDFDISNATVDDDVYNKIDFILDLVNKRRGVGVETNPTADDLKKGYQVTLITTGSSEFKHKLDQVLQKQENFRQAKEKGKERPVDDLVLINPGEEFEDVSAILKLWQRQGQVAGGPENFLSIERSVEKYLKDIFKGTKLDFDKRPEFLEEIKQSFRYKGIKEKDKV